MPEQDRAAPVTVVALAGVGGSLGRRIAEGVAAAAAVDATVVLAEGDAGPLDGVDALVHAGGDITGAQPVLAAASVAGIDTLVVVSSATVYGAWPDNPVPLTEDAPLRPVPRFAHAVERAELERLATSYREARPGAAVAVLRPVVCVGPGLAGEPPDVLVGAGRLRIRDESPPAQFLHPDDLVSAVVLALTQRLDGPFNVAPDGWVPGETVPALASGALALALPERVVRPLRRVAQAMGLSGVPTAALPYGTHPWVVANDRLRAAGWEPAHSNEEALVAGRRGSWFRELSPKRRQELTLGAAGGGALAAVAGVVALARRRTRRQIRRRGPRGRSTSSVRVMREVASRE